jgi:hypothetical protein
MVAGGSGDFATDPPFGHKTPEEWGTRKGSRELGSEVRKVKSLDLQQTASLEPCSGGKRLFCDWGLVCAKLPTFRGKRPRWSVGEM